MNTRTMSMAERQDRNVVMTTIGTGNSFPKGPLQMLNVIAQTLGMCANDYTNRSRQRNIVELRFVAALLLRNHFPRVTLKEIASFFGGQDHTSVINAIGRGYELLAVSDSVFTEKYHTASYSVNQWLKDGMDLLMNTKDAA